MFKNTGNNRRRTFIKISYGSFMRKDSDGEWITFDTIANVFLKKVERVEKDFGKSELTLMWEFTLEDANTAEVCLVSVNDESRYANLLLNRFENVKRGEEITLKGYNFQNEGRDIVGVTVYWAGDTETHGRKGKVTPLHSKETPNGLPQARKYEGKKGKTEWDFSAQMDYYVDVFKKRFEPMAETNLDASDAKNIIEEELDDDIKNYLEYLP